MPPDLEAVRAYFAERAAKVSAERLIREVVKALKDSGQFADASAEDVWEAVCKLFDLSLLQRVAIKAKYDRLFRSLWARE